jgi:hypothetical protein
MHKEAGRDCFSGARGPFFLSEDALPRYFLYQGILNL